MGRGIVGTVGLAVTLAFALPIGLLGLQRAVQGDSMGVVLVVVAVLMVAIEEYLVTPTDLPALAGSRVLGAVAKDPEEREEPEER